MKKGLVLIAALALMAGMAPSLFAEPAGELPQMVQAGFYTKTYQCFYLKGTDELGLKYTPNEWNTYETEISKKTITYDGMNGKHKKLALLRVKSNTKKSNVPLVIYVDNVTLKDEDGNVVFFLDFEDGDPAGAYFSQGKPADENGTVVQMDGRTCFMINMTTQNLYGYNGVEVQWNLPETDKTKDRFWDFTSGKYSVSYDYYIAVAE
ncbi:MAG TPA: hypothetical protein PK786_07325 [Treponemataceae bacterium]|nr:hypothetical protein [Treponemataceae bacterium]HQF73687.1 hypothetical protein [Treponemataceae bacterium]